MRENEIKNGWEKRRATINGEVKRKENNKKENGKREEKEIEQKSSEVTGREFKGLKRQEVDR